MYKYIYTKEHIPYMKEQIWQIDSSANGNLDYYSQLSDAEFSVIKEFINPDVKNIMDLGCGMGRCGINLYHKLKDKQNIKIFFGDSNFVAANSGGSVVPENDEHSNYNNLLKTESFVSLNKVENYEIKNIMDENFPKGLPKMDLIISMYSVGYHFCMNKWLERLHPVMTQKTTVVFGVWSSDLRLAVSGKSYQSLSQVKKIFSCVSFHKGLRGKSPHCDYLVATGYKG